MKLTKERKVHIDIMSYKQLLSHWRFAPSGDKWFEGETGVYWAKRMAEIKPENHSEISKQVGW